jgi:hypothetical protein
MSGLKENKFAIVAVLKEEEGTFGRMIERILAHEFICAYRIREIDELGKMLSQLHQKCKKGEEAK